MKNKNWWAIGFAGLGVGSLLIVALAILWSLFGVKSGTRNRWAGVVLDSRTAQKVCVEETFWIVAAMPLHYEMKTIPNEQCPPNAVKTNFIDVDELNSYYPEANCRDSEGFKVICDQEVELFKLMRGDMQ